MWMAPHFALHMADTPHGAFQNEEREAHHEADRCFHAPSTSLDGLNVPSTLYLSVTGVLYLYEMHRRVLRIDREIPILRPISVEARPARVMATP
jgi:hypothetical protein